MFFTLICWNRWRLYRYWQRYVICMFHKWLFGWYMHKWLDLGWLGRSSFTSFFPINLVASNVPNLFAVTLSDSCDKKDVFQNSALLIHTFDFITYNGDGTLSGVSDAWRDIAILYEIYASFEKIINYVLNSSKLCTGISVPYMKSNDVFQAHPRPSSNCKTPRYLVAIEL